jgi:uncharacterized protein
MGKASKFFFVTDVHGSDVCFRKFLNAAKFYKANVLILGGDICGKSMIPVVETGNGTYECSYAGEDVVLKSKEQAESLMKEMRDSGIYTLFMQGSEFEELNARPEMAAKVFDELMLQGVKKWLALAEERLKETNTKCFISPGNDDIPEIDQILDSSTFVVNPERKVLQIDDAHEMITLGVVNHTPWHSPREADEEVLQSMIEKMAANLERPENSIFNIHVPPIDTAIDQAPKVTPDLKPVVNAGHIVMTSAGSVATRKMIEKYQPLMSLHGHIHEAKGLAKLGRTVCFNPGSEYTEGVLRGVVGQLEDGKLKSYLLTSG